MIDLLRNEWEYSRRRMLMEVYDDRIRELVYFINLLEGYESYLDEDSGLFLGKKEEDSWENEHQKKQEGFSWSRNPVTKTYSLNLQKNSKTSSILIGSLYLDEMKGLCDNEVQIKSAERFMIKLIGIVEFMQQKTNEEESND